MTSNSGVLAHDALLYDSDEAFASALVPFVRDGFAAGHATIAVTTPRNIELLQRELAQDTGDISYIDADEWYRRPAVTISSYREALDERVAAGADVVRVIGEVQFGADDRSQTDWVRYEAMLNQIFHDSPAWIVCPYDTRALAPSVISSAERTHPHVLRGARRGASSGYVDPADLLRALPAAPTDLSDAVLVDEIGVTHRLDLSRRALRAAARRAAVPDERIPLLTLAANEIFTNGLLHGGPPVLARIWRTPDSVICEVTDGGAGISNPFAGYEPPRAEDGPEGGMGLWVARQLCDFVELVPGKRFAVRLGLLV